MGNNINSKKEIEIIRGDTPAFTINVTDNGGDAFDLTSYSMRMTVKRNKADTDTNAIIGPKIATIASPTTGIGVITLSSTDTDVDPGEYLYDIQINNGSSNVYTIIGPKKFTVIDDITKTES